MGTGNLRAEGLPVHPPVAGVIEGVEDPELVPSGTLIDGENMVPLRSPLLATRGGSRILLTLHDDAGSPAELSHVLACAPRPATGGILIGWSSGTTKHYVYAVTSDMAFAGASEALSRTAFPATWNRATPARPVLANLFEKHYVCDAQAVYGNRNTLVGIDTGIPPTLNEPTFAFVPGGAGAAALRPYTLEEYNNVLFIAGYGDEEASTGDDPALVRHSLLGSAPDAADGFDKDAYSTIGAKGDRVTAMRKGRGLLLVAKQTELYRISGFGRRYPGWQYQVEGVQNKLGVGVENPLALDHADPYWYGIGKHGPFRTNGYDVESLVGPRARTWAGIDQLGQSFVRYHPERHVVLFGVHVVAGAPDATYPWILLVWDTDREVWQPNWRLTGSVVRMFGVQAIPTTTTIATAGPPTGLNTTGETETGFTANWTNVDATAYTEYWERAGSGVYALVDVLAPGVATKVRTGLSNHTLYNWKVRHTKGGIPSGFSLDQPVHTLISPPGVVPSCFAPPFGFPHGTIITVTQNSDGTDLSIETSPDGANYSVLAVYPAAPLGTYYASDVTGTHWYRARSSDGGWTPIDSTLTVAGPITCT